MLFTLSTKYGYILHLFAKFILNRSPPSSIRPADQPLGEEMKRSEAVTTIMYLDETQVFKGGLLIGRARNPVCTSLNNLWLTLFSNSQISISDMTFCNIWWKKRGGQNYFEQYQQYEEIANAAFSIFHIKVYPIVQKGFSWDHPTKRKGIPAIKIHPPFLRKTPNLGDPQGNQLKPHRSQLPEKFQNLKRSVTAAIKLCCLQLSIL